MALAVQDLMHHALTLPPNSRAYLAEALLESLDFEEDFPVDQTWIAEIDRRCREIDAGEVVLISGEEGLSQLHRKYL